MAKPAKKNAADALVNETIAAIRAGKLSRTELDLLRALVETAKEKALADKRVQSLAGELGVSDAKLWMLEAKHAPKKRGRRRRPPDHGIMFTDEHMVVIQRLLEAGERGLTRSEFQVRVNRKCLPDKTVQRRLKDLGKIVICKGKRWSLRDEDACESAREWLRDWTWGQ